MPTLSDVTPLMSDSDPCLAQLALDLCLDDELAARYLAVPELVLAERGIVAPAENSLIDGDSLLPTSGLKIVGITWCFSTVDDDTVDNDERLASIG